MPSASSLKLCPICAAPPVREFAPFCSPGCRDRDLLQWLGEGYRIPGPPIDPLEQTELRDGLDRD
ncbi:DNA gyrase inhibitor YacG [Sphingomonas sp. ID0503]|uniref:DNA gyrase inhibitor YacG n=1 Tax=Sphingomonas sp. ID0503 TaxID=3399691 RepID=UPI003AFA1A3F